MRSLFFTIIGCLINFLLLSQRSLHSERLPSRDNLDTLEINLNQRYALIIGNTEYEHPDKLINPGHDAMGVDSILKQYSFETRLLLDADFKVMESAILSFADTVKRNRGVALFYFSGHGFQHSGENYLTPVNTSHNKFDQFNKFISLGQLIGRLTYSRNSVTMCIIDACRNIPSVSIPNLNFTYNVRSSGNTLLFFSTSSEEYAYDGTKKFSPFTSAFINALGEVKVSKEIEIREVVDKVNRVVPKATSFGQIPQAVSSMREAVLLKRDYSLYTPPVAYLTNSNVGAVPGNLYVYTFGIDELVRRKLSVANSKRSEEFADFFAKALSDKFRFVFKRNLKNEYATNSAIYNSIEEVQKVSTRSDAVVFYFNGKMIYDDLVNETYFIPFDGDSTEKVTLQSVTEIFREIRKCFAQPLVIFELNGETSNSILTGMSRRSEENEIPVIVNLNSDSQQSPNKFQNYLSERINTATGFNFQQLLQDIVNDNIGSFIRSNSVLIRTLK